MADLGCIVKHFLGTELTETDKELARKWWEECPEAIKAKWVIWDILAQYSNDHMEHLVSGEKE